MLNGFALSWLSRAAFRYTPDIHLMENLFHTHAWTADMEAPAEQTAEPAMATDASLVTAHSIYLLYPFRIATNRQVRGENARIKSDRAAGKLPAGPVVRLGALTEATWQPGLSTQQQNLAEKIQAKRTGNGDAPAPDPAPVVGESARLDENIWCEAIWNIAPEMEPQVKRLLSSWAAQTKAAPNDDRKVTSNSSQGLSGDEDDAAGDAVRVWMLKKDNRIREALRGRVGLARYLQPQLAVEFSPGALKRLEARLGTKPPMSATIAIDKLRVLTFSDDLGLLITEIKVEGERKENPIAPALLTEALVAACGDRNWVWLGRDDIKFPARAEKCDLTLRTMLSTLLGDYAEPDEVTGARRQKSKSGATGGGIGGARTFSYTSVTLDKPLAAADRQRLMAQLACKYTDDYRIEQAAFAQRIYQPFESVSHLTSLEGVVTLVENSPFDNRARAEFLNTFGSNAVEPRYLPVVVLAYHAFLALLHLTQDSRRQINLKAPSSQEAAYLSKLRDRALEFRLYYRLSYVSLLTMPNELYHRLGDALGLDRMLASVDRDLTELSALLDARVKKAEAAQANWFRRVATALLVFISGATFFRTVFDVFLSTEMVDRRFQFLLALGCAIVVAALAFWFSDGGIDREVHDELTVDADQAMSDG